MSNLTMSSSSASTSKDLDSFLQTWKQELNQQNAGEGTSSTKDDSTKSTANDFPKSEERISITNSYSLSFTINQPAAFHDDSSQDAVLCDAESKAAQNKLETDTNEYYPFKILTKFLNEAPKKKEGNKQLSKKQTTPDLTYSKRKYFANLSSAERPSKKSRDDNDKDSNESQETKTKTRFLDLFIADLDDINEIPFFDTTIPREVAMKIFQHLDMKSLCMCSQVSKSWRSLADDELLWCEISHSLGYNTDLHVSQAEGWKVTVQRHLEQKRLLQSNWKVRIGKPYHLNFAQGGVLCAATSKGSNIIAGYTSCQLRCWDAETGDICTLTASNTALVIDETTEDLGLIRNEVTEVAVTSSITAAAFRHGFVDVWHNDEGTESFHTLSFRNPHISSIAACDAGPLGSLLAATQKTRVQISRLDHGEGTTIHDFDMTKPVVKNMWYTPTSGPAQLVLSCHSSVHLKTIIDDNTSAGSSCAATTDSSVTELHNIIWAPISHVGVRASNQEVAVGYTHAEPASKVKLTLYDVTSRHQKASLSGHTWVISCMHLPEALTSQLVTGSADRRIRMFDLRAGHLPTLTLPGHNAKVTCVEMDEWKVVSGDEAGFVFVWDQRVGKKLWDVHNRHPVQYCHFEDRLLIIGNVPYEKRPQFEDEFDKVTLLRDRGTVQVYDFLANQMRQGIPDVCLSTYEEPKAYDYNIGLAMPYDKV